MIPGQPAIRDLSRPGLGCSLSPMDLSHQLETSNEQVAPQGGRELYQVVRGMLGWLKWWARLEVRGLEVVPAGGPVLVVSNHDSWLDPLALIEAMMWKDRPLRFLAKDGLWNSRLLAAILDRAGQIPIRRGAGDDGALSAALTALEHGEAIAIFPEGTISRGKDLRARRGVSRLVRACPGVPVILAAVEGGTVLRKFPRRPRVIVEFFLPRAGQPGPKEDLQDLADRLLAETREKVLPAGGRAR